MGTAVNAFLMCTSAVVGLFSPIAVVGNALVLTAILRKPSLKTPSNILLAGLAFTDFGTGLISQPFYVINVHMGMVFNVVLLDKSTWPTEYLVLKIIGDGLCTYFFLLSILTITVMSIERWLHMSRRSLVTMRRVCRAIIVLLPTPIPLVVYQVRYQYTIAVNITTMLSLLFCLTVTSVAYFKVFRIIREHQQQIHASEISRGAAQQIINIAKYKKSVKTILYILAIFYTGYFSVTISMGLRMVFKYNDVSLLVFNMSVVLAFLSSSLNPALYLWRMKEIRDEVKRLVNKILC